MIFDRNENKPVIALLGAGSMGTAIVRRIAHGKKILLGDISEKNLEKVSHDFQYSGYNVETMIVNALEKDSVYAFARKAAELGPVMVFMKKMISVLMILAVLLGTFTAFAEEQPASPRILVAYLSRAGENYNVGETREGSASAAYAG